MHHSPKYLFAMVGLALSWIIALWLTFASPAIIPLRAASNDSLDAAPTVLTVTVGTEPNNCPTTSSITVSMGTLVYYCYLLKNNSEFTLTHHSLLDDQQVRLLNNEVLTITPSSGITPAQQILGQAEVLKSVHTLFTWVATSTTGLTFTASGEIHIVVPELALTSTVSTAPGSCGTENTLDVKAGTQVYYCYRLHNRSAMSLKIPQIDVGGEPLVDGRLPLTLEPDAAINLTATAQISETTAQVISVTGFTDDGLTTTAQANTTVQVPAINVHATVGLVPNTCAEESTIQVAMGSSVIYCFAVTNQGGVPFTHRRIAGPGLPKPYVELTQTVSAILSTAAVTESTVYPVTWVAWNDQNLTATASSLVTVTTLASATVQLYYDVNNDHQRTPGEPVIPDTTVRLAHPTSSPITATTNQAGIVVLKNISAKLYTFTVTGTHFRSDFLLTEPHTLDLRGQESQTVILPYTVPLTVDDDGDGVPNWREGAGDQDGDGIVDYLDYALKVFIAVLRRPK